ncbi:TRAP transporter substrate-binding protein DctP [Dysosmobacter sp.]|uniref:TRAP transporter substrate-binding protein DctP n=1 Tax=Dysosmobacter sp. TaxID=2591382 RepID=UPI002A8C0714|nr:TRAP transporter substrate-binding protein DctP [Dysosmobacter sp.]MDY3281329.1 TRAP transporter substrate-binding protein DctP [Dysosmobacter sp.]
MKKFLAMALALTMALSLAACGGSGSSSGSAAPAPAASGASSAAASTGTTFEKQTWKFACSATENTCWADMGRDFGQMVSDATGGAVTVEVYAADQLTAGNQTEGIQGAIDGTIELSAHSNIIYANFDQRLNVVSMPFLFDSYDDVDAKLTGEPGAAVGKVVEDLGLHLLGVGENGFRAITNSKRPIESLADMQGLKIRVAGCKVLNTAYGMWGANWSNANWSEVYTGLQTGTYDGQENPLPTADGASIQEVNKYCANWTGIYDCIFFTMNKDLYDSLSPELQQIVDECGAKAAENQRKLQREGVEQVMKKWTDAGVTITELSDAAVAEFKAATEPMYTDPEIVSLLTEDLINAFTA